MTDINVEKVAKLARLELNKSEEAYFKEKFNAIMEYVGQISEVEITDDMKEKDESLQKIYRSDVIDRTDIKLEDFSSTVENNFFKVPKVIE